VKALFVVSLLVLSASQAFAGFQGTVEFSDAEKAAHLAGLDTLTKTAAACMKNDLALHNQYMRKYGVSKFFGENTDFARASKDQRREMLAELGHDPDLVNEMLPTSCVGLALKCLSQGFKAANQGEIWEKLRVYTKANGQSGLALQEGLRALGWKVFYWNPDPSRSAEWDKYERWVDPKDTGHNWGYHQEHWLQVQKSQRYLYNHVDDFKTFAGFGVNPPSVIQRAPIFVGTGHGGYHVFPGYYGNVLEAHSIRPLTDPHTVQLEPFNPMANGGGPNGLFRSGLIALPPGY
jgi:hypothetical protein